MAKIKQTYRPVKISETNGDYKKVARFAKREKISVIKALSLLINHECGKNI